MALTYGAAGELDVIERYRNVLVTEFTALSAHQFVLAGRFDPPISLLA